MPVRSDGSVAIESNIESWRATLQNYPQFVNAQSNRDMVAGMKSLGRKMARGPHARGGSFQVRSKNNARPKRFPVVRIARKAQVAGWRATVQKRNKLDGKYAEFKTRNPLLIGREFGRRIRSRRGKGLLIQIRSTTDRIKKRFRTKKPIYIRPRLGARAIIRFHRFEMSARLKSGFDKAVVRAEREAERKARKRRLLVYAFVGESVRRLAA